jgi:SWI/SNF-related matrix-associated actin-dependent regulator of chromatin subfamily A member 5
MASPASNSNGSTSSSSVVTPAEVPTPSNVPDGGRGKRFEFLLQQTELFAHFMGAPNKAKSPLKMKKTTVKETAASRSAKEGDHRHRMTEQEEDEELLTGWN